MRTASGVVAALLLAVAGASQVREGTRARADGADYPAHAERDGIAIGAAILSPDQVRNTFATDLNRGYLVVEVALYPNSSSSVDVARSDFALRIAGTQTARAANPRAIAASRQKGANSPGNIDVYPQVGIGYESGPRGYDPVTGTVRGGGIRTSAGVGVGGGAPGPASTDRDRKTMELELLEKSLPEGATTRPVAGYLYFPLAARKKSATYELEYQAPGGRIALRLPPVSGK